MNLRHLLVSSVPLVAGLLFLSFLGIGQPSYRLQASNSNGVAVTVSDALADVPCLLALAQNSVYGSFDTIYGCYGSSGEFENEYSYDQFGRINGFESTGIITDITTSLAYAASVAIDAINPPE